MNNKNINQHYDLIFAKCSEPAACAKVNWDDYQERNGPLSNLEQLEIKACLMYVDPSLSIDECLARRVANITANTTMVHRGKHDEAERFIQVSERIFQIDPMARMLAHSFAEIQVNDFVVIKNGESTMVFSIK